MSIDEYIPRSSPVARSLNDPRLLLGAPLKLTAINAFLALAFIYGPGFWWWLGVTLVIQSFLKWMTKKDPEWLTVLLKYMKQGDFFEPWPKRNQKQNLRPEGFGRDLLK